MRNTIKRVLLRLVGISGMLHLLRFVHRKKITVFMLHGIVEDKEYPWKTIRGQCALQRFDSVLQILKKYFEFISMEEAVAMLSGKVPMRPYCAVMTFDDGYKNNFEVALPILQKYRIPAIFFIPTGNITNQEPLWFDMLDYMIQAKNKNAFCLEVGGCKVVFGGKYGEVSEASYREFLRCYNKGMKINDIGIKTKINNFIKSWEEKVKMDLKKELQQDSRMSMMSWPQIEAVVKNGIEIGSHTVDHCRLGTLDEEEIRYQLEKSKRDIEKHIKKPCRFLCYPNGSYSADVIRIATECGYEAAVTTEAGFNNVGDNLYALSRIGFPVRADKYHILYHIYGKSMNKIIKIWRMKCGK